MSVAYSTHDIHKTHTPD